MEFSGDVSITYGNKCTKCQKNDITGYRDIRTRDTLKVVHSWLKGYGCISLTPYFISHGYFFSRNRKIVKV